MNYSLLLLPTALKELKGLPREFRRQVGHRIEGLKIDPRPPQSKALKGECKGLYRLRCGSYRVLYKIDDSSREVIVSNVGDRRDVYK